MNKKQAGIIVTLLALIVCAGILAARVNGPLQVNDGFNDGSSVFNWGKTDNSKNTDTFLSVKSQRDVDDAATLSAYNAILDKKDLSDEEKTQTMAQLTLKTKQMDYEKRIEGALKVQEGFADVICMLEEDNTKARVIVKAKEMSTKDIKVIKDVVRSVSKITNVEISNKQ